MTDGPTDSAANLLDTDTFLPCGRDPHEVLDQVTAHGPDARDAHQRDCVHCQAALAEFDRLWRPMRVVTAHRPAAPDGVLDAVLSKIRGVAEDPEFGRVDDGFGHTRVSGRVVTAIARRHAAGVPGVRGALGKLALAGHRSGPRDTQFPETSVHAAHPADMAAGPRVSAGVAGASTAIEVVLAADFGHDLHTLARRVRQAVVAGVRFHCGLEPVAVNVVVDDVLPPAG